MTTSLLQSSTSAFMVPWMMNEVLKARCASKPRAVSPQRQRCATDSRKSSRNRRLRERRRRHCAEGSSSSGSSSSSSEDICSTCNDVPFRINERLTCIGCNKRRPSFSDTESVLEILNMPVGTTNSILKSSFSLTSLRSCTPTDSPDHGAKLRLKTERPYNSLTKKKSGRRSSEQDKEQWRKSWGSGISQDGKEFWEGFQADYDYLMAQNILEREASETTIEKVSGGTPTAPPAWSHSEFMDQFAQLYSWLKGIQDSVYGKQENVTDWKLRAERQEDMQRQRFRLETFNEESKKMTTRYPELESEVTWLVKHINDKWETVEAMMGGSKAGEGEKRCQMGSRQRVKHEIKCLRKWLRELETKLKPLSFQCGWTKAELEMKTKEHMVLHRDIEAHRKIVSFVLKLCEEVDSSVILARALERKYHEYYLRSLEWQCHIESLIGLQLNKSASNLSTESDGEPVAKIPRFSSQKDTDDGYENEDSDCCDALKSDEESSKEDDWCMDTSCLETTNAHPTSEGTSSRTMVGADAKRGDESIFGGMGDSTSLLGTRPTNSANILFSCANLESESRSNSVEKSAVFAPKSKAHGVAKKEYCLLRDYTAADANRSTTRPPNIATFIGRHLDTDSEQEMMEQEESKGKEEASKEEMEEEEIGTTSSEDGWTHMTGAQTEKSEAGVQTKPKAAAHLDFSQSSPKNTKELKYFSAKNIPRSNHGKMQNGKEPISPTNRKLVDRVEELVRCKVKCRRNARVKQWLKEGEANSCDASWECTTEDSDKESQSSEDQDGSVATCRRTGSAEGILEDTPKAAFDYVLRGQRHLLRNRPWSMSSVSWLRNPRGQNLKSSRPSMSESALNQIIGEKFYVTPARGVNKTICVDGVYGSGGSSRRKRTKIRKRMNKKGDSGSDGITLSGSDSPNRSSPHKHISCISGLVKSGSFSGIIRRQRDFSPTFTKCDSVSGTETDDDANRLNPPVFRLGPNAGAVTVVTTEQGKTQVEEQLSLNSDQIDWDHYQEKYQSEAYSEEPPDSEAAKKLLDFGEDYGKFLGNQSDCASSLGRQSYTGRRRNKFDSDSDMDEVKKFLRESLDQVDLSEMMFSKSDTGLFSTNNLASEDFVSWNFFDEIIATCKRNIDCLSRLLDEARDEMLPSKEHKDIQNVKERWENLKATAELRKGKQLQRDITLLKDELLSLATTVESMETTVASREELESKIIQVKNELNSIRERKCKLLQANLSVHRFLSTTNHAETSLRDEVTDLYQVWDQTFCRVSSQLCNLQSLSQAWLDFENHLCQLQTALRTDQDTLKVLDFAIKCGKPSTDVAISLRDIARVLSEKEPVSKNPLVTVDGSTAPTTATAVKVPGPILTEGSLSDSGISDSGSEQELSEREKRLTQLKRLAKHLEGILAPGSQALSNMFKRIEEAEAELRGLQKTCRDLIVRSANSSEFRMMVAKASSLNNLDAEMSACPMPKSSVSGTRIKTLGFQEDKDEEDDEVEEDCEGGKSGKKSWLWRLIRFSLPFQLALVAILCVACMMEPRCCDSVNNLGMSLDLQLRYDSGPPPV